MNVFLNFFTVTFPKSASHVFVKSEEVKSKTASFVRNLPFLALTLNFNTIKYAVHLSLKKSFTVKRFSEFVIFNCSIKIVFWQFVKVYTDEGISGTNTKNRNGFNEMIQDALDGKIDIELVNECVNENARKKQSQDAYAKKYNSLVRRYERAEKRLNKATVEREDKVNKERELRLFFETLENKPQLIDTWDENLWITLVEKMEVSHDKECEVFFKNGVSVKVNI